MNKCTFGKEYRLKKWKDIKNILSNGKRIYSEEKYSIFYRNSIENIHFSILLNKKVKGSVKRNRIKRIFREIFRLNKNYFNSKIDMIIIINRNFKPDYNILKKQFLYICNEKNIISKKK